MCPVPLKQNKATLGSAAPPLSPLQCGEPAAGGSAAAARPEPCRAAHTPRSPPSSSSSAPRSPEGGSRRRRLRGLEIGGGAGAGLSRAEQGAEQQHRQQRRFPAAARSRQGQPFPGCIAWRFFLLFILFSKIEGN